MTDAEIITTIGTCELSRRMGVPPSRVSHWKKRGIPFAQRMRVLDVADEFILDAEAFMRGDSRK